MTKHTTSDAVRRVKVQMRQENEEAWSRADRLWAERRDRCVCIQPRPGPRYLNETRCTCCKCRIR